MVSRSLLPEVVAVLINSCWTDSAQQYFAFCYFQNSFVADWDLTVGFHTKYEFKVVLLQLIKSCCFDRRVVGSKLLVEDEFIIVATQFEFSVVVTQ